MFSIWHHATWKYHIHGLLGPLWQRAKSWQILGNKQKALSCIPLRLHGNMHVCVIRLPKSSPHRSSSSLLQFKEYILP